MLLDPARLLALDVPLAAFGTEIRVSAAGPGDAGVPVAASLTVMGRAIRPPSPVALTATAGDDIALTWTRRSRAAWTWLDGADAPLGEDAERYRVTLMPTSGASRTAEVTAPAFTYTAADRLADGASGSLTIDLRQLGTWAASDAATLTLPL